MKKGQNTRSVCFYFQVHQPLRLSKFRFFDFETKKDYFSDSGKYNNQFFINKVGQKSYYPANTLLNNLIKKYPEFKVSFSISGVALEQFEKYDKKLLRSFQDLVATGNVELLNETYYHSLSWIYSKAEFAAQIELHRKKIWQIFKKRPKVFRNTELIYNNELANFVLKLGFDAILAEGWDYYLKGRSPNYLYTPPKFKLHEADQELADKFKFRERPAKKIKLLLKNYKLSDDIAFRFSDKNWKEHPLTVEKFANWLDQTPGDTINLFMDYETFGEHQWSDSGIFEFIKHLPAELLKRGYKFRTPSETANAFEIKDTLDIHSLLSWADMERDISAWLGNKMQQEAAKLVFECEPILLQISQNFKPKQKSKLFDTWRKLQTSDHFYYMSTKYWNDGDIHKYFSPYDSPYDAYINYMNVLADFRLELEKITEGIK